MSVYCKLTKKRKKVIAHVSLKDRENAVYPLNTLNFLSLYVKKISKLYSNVFNSLAYVKGGRKIETGPSSFSIVIHVVSNVK